jgi:hypothetical protein
MAAEYFPLGRGCDMSEGEYERQWALCNEQDPPSRSVRRGFWRTQSGHVLAIKEMTAVHLMNAIHLSERAGTGKHPKIQELREELASR